MSYELNFHPDALDEWRKLDKSVRAGFRMVYEMIEARLVVLVVAVGKRERSAVYKSASRR